MIYIILFISISLFTFSCGLFKNKEKLIFLLFSFILTNITVFRYGSGSDYFGYMWHYNLIPSKLIDAINYQSNMNIGYRIFMAISKNLNISFIGFVGITGIIVMYLFINTIINKSKFRMMSLLLFYGIYYPVYINSALRQGIALAIFVWSFFKYYSEGQKIKYFLAIIIASLFHYSAAITLLVFIIDSKSNKKLKNYKMNIILCIISIISFILGGEKLLVKIAATFGINIFAESTGANFLAILLRVVILIIILVLYKNCDKNKLSKFEELCIYMYFINVIVFISVCNMPLLSRLTEYFSILEIFLIPNLISMYKIRVNKIIMILLITLITGVVFIKDQYSFIQQGSYYNKKVIQYPYVTIFNKDDIYKYRYIIDEFKPR